MARMIRVTGTGPIKIEPQEKAVFICGCGLTKKFPFCDGTHKCCKEEEPEALYRYDAETNEAVRIEPPTDAGSSRSHQIPRAQDQVRSSSPSSEKFFFSRIWPAKV